MVKGVRRTGERTRLAHFHRNPGDHFRFHVPPSLSTVTRPRYYTISKYMLEGEGEVTRRDASTRDFAGITARSLESFNADTLYSILPLNFSRRKERIKQRYFVQIFFHFSFEIYKFSGRFRRRDFDLFVIKFSVEIRN